MIMNKCLKLFLLFFVLSFFPSTTYSWNSIGHELVAQIAYDQLTPSQQKFWKNQIEALRVAYPKENYIKASTLPDELRGHDVNAFNTWHYINLPIFTSQHHYRYYISSENILWALQQSFEVEKSHYANLFEKAFFASFLIHLVGDAHQPLHCASLYNAHFPQGDRGGNLYKIKNYRWHNLHAYWDNGGEFLSKRLIKNEHGLEEAAKMLEKKYPPSYFKNRLQQKNFKTWIQESHDIAKDFVYTIEENGVPSKAYQVQTQNITQEQIVLAGYRLGKILKDISK
jgi:hypothetical protein